MKYLLRPEPILPQISLTDALLWIYRQKIPDIFYDINNETQHHNLVSASCVAEDNLLTRNLWENYDITKQGIFSVVKQKASKELDQAKHKLYSAIVDGKIKIYGIQAKYHKNEKDYTKHTIELNEVLALFGGGQTTEEEIKNNIKEAKDVTNIIKNIEYKQIDTSNLIYADIDWDKEQIRNKNNLYKFLLISTEDLFKLYPLDLKPSKQTKFGHNNYFIDDEENTEIIINCGRKSLLTSTQIEYIRNYAIQISKTGKHSIQTITHRCIGKIKQEFKKEVSFSTATNYLSGLNLKNQNT